MIDAQLHALDVRNPIDFRADLPDDVEETVRTGDTARNTCGIRIDLNADGGLGLGADLARSHEIVAERARRAADERTTGADRGGDFPGAKQAADDRRILNGMLDDLGLFDVLFAVSLRTAIAVPA